MQFSRFGDRFGRVSGIKQLMDDLGEAMSGQRDMLMLGGGNPAHIPGAERVWRVRMQDLLSDGNRFERMLADYDTAQGSPAFIEALVGFLNRQYGWGIGPENVAIANGAQTALFCLLNMFSGEMADGSRRRILFPVMPEYIGYADQGLYPDCYRAFRPRIELLPEREFKYHVDFDRFEMGDDAGAICVSRPTNPSGNVLTDAEIGRLCGLAEQRGIPLIVDNAYGNPFPGVMFSDATPPWRPPTTILTFSLSKLGLPGTRTGIVVGPPEVTQALVGVNSILSLASGNVGQQIVAPLLRDDRIVEMVRDVIRPFYEDRSRQAHQWLTDSLEGTEYVCHRREGSLFLWVWLRGLSITTRELYERLKARGVLVLPGEYFFFGLDEPWDHGNECVRLSYAQDAGGVRKGIAILGEECRRFAS